MNIESFIYYIRIKYLYNSNIKNKSKEIIKK